MRQSGNEFAATLRRLVGLLVATGALLAILLMAGVPSISQSYLPNPLAPPDTDSPRATLNSLETEVNEAERLMRETYARHIKEPGWFMSKETARAQDIIAAHLDRAMRCLDLSDVPPANRRKTALETVMLLEEILDRVGLPPAAEIPDAAMMKTQTEKGGLQQWTVPKTEIRIVKIDKGPAAGEYQFSSDSVSRAYEFYQKVRAIKPPDGFDFYAFYALSPGELVPPKWYAYIQLLPPWFHQVYIDSAHWQWIALGLTLLLALSFAFAAYSTTRPSGFLTKHLPHWLTTLILPAAVLLAIWAAGWFIDLLNFTGPVQRALASSSEVALYLPLAWLAVVVCNRIADWISFAWSSRRYSFDTGILRVVIRLFGALTATAILAYGASQIGVPLVGILAGLGVGGLAVALAAQPTLENLIGGIMIYADRPVRVGDRGKFGDIVGTVEEIGIRSTRIRLPDRSVTTVPNGDFSKARLTNYSSRDRVLFTTTIGLAYGIKEKQVRNIVKRIRDLLMSQPHMNHKKAEVRFAGFGGDSLLVEIAGEFVDMPHEELPSLREELYLRLFSIVEKSGGKLMSHD